MVKQVETEVQCWKVQRPTNGKKKYGYTLKDGEKVTQLEVTELEKRPWYTY